MALVLSADVLLCDKFRLDRHLGRLCERNGGASVPIGSRALDVLGVLIEQPGHLASKDEIMNAVWPGLAVEESNLTVQISALRRILDTGGSQSSCIQTVPGRGYRFVGTVSPIEPQPVAGAPNGAAREDMDAEGRPPEILSLPSHTAGLSSVPMPRWPQARRRIAIISAAGLAVLLLALLALAGPGAALFRTPESRWVGRGSAPSPLSIVVLPFTDLSAARDQQYFADSVTEDVTADLSNIAGMRVISPSSAFTYRDKTVAPKQIGRELGVRYVMEGSVRRSGEQVRINAQLIDAESNVSLWAGRFDRDVSDLFALQDEISGRLANSLNVAMVRAEAARPTDNPDALDHLFRGRAVLANSISRERYAAAINSYERALVLDPRFVEAQGRLAMALTGRVLDRMTDTENADVARAEKLIAQVLAVSPSDARGHLVKGQLLRIQHRCAEAIPEFEAALASNRNWVGALSHLGRCKARLGLLDEAIALQEQAIRLDPVGSGIAVYYLRIGSARLLQSRVREAIAWLEKARAANPRHPWVRAHLTAAYAIAGEADRAVAELAEARRLGGDEFLPSIAQARAKSTIMDGPAIATLAEATYFAGLRAAGVPEK